MHLEFKRLAQIKPADITALNNHPKVLQQMPLGSPDFDDEKSLSWAKEKDAQWDINGYGPGICDRRCIRRLGRASERR